MLLMVAPFLGRVRLDDRAFILYNRSGAFFDDEGGEYTPPICKQQHTPSPTRSRGLPFGTWGLLIVGYF